MPNYRLYPSYPLLHTLGLLRGRLSPGISAWLVFGVQCMLGYRERNKGLKYATQCSSTKYTCSPGLEYFTFFSFVF